MLRDRPEPSFELGSTDSADGVQVVIDTKLAEHVLSSTTVTAAVELLPEALSVFRTVRDGAGRVVDFGWLFANGAACRSIGFTASELIGRTLLDVSPDSEVFEVYCTVVETGQPHVETRWTTGRKRQAFEVRVSRLDDGLVVVSRDVTEQREQAEALVQQRAELRRAHTESRLLNELGELLQGCLSSEEAHAVVASSCQALFPGSAGALSVRESEGRYETVAVWGEEPVAAPVFGATDCWALRLGRAHVSDLREPRCQHLEGAVGYGCLCVPLTSGGQKTGVLHVMDRADAVVADPVLRLSQTVGRQVALALNHLRLRDELRDLSVRDPLTGLFHRRYLEETVTRELARVTWSGTSLGVIQIDIDHFARFNEDHGHEAGNAVLKAVAEILVKSSRVSDVACRYGGEAFTLLLPDAPPHVTGARAEELRQRVEDLRVRHRRQELAGVTISCGVASGPENGQDASSLLRAAADALYEAKRSGRNGVIRASATG